MNIPETGILYDLPFSEYLACKTHYSSSEIRLILEAPRLLFEKRASPPEDPDKSCFRQGSALHALALENKRDYAVLPEKMPDAKGQMVDSSFRLKSSKDWLEKQKAAGKNWLSRDEAEEVENWAAAIRADEEAGLYLKVPGKTEVSMFGVEPETGVLLRIRIDWMPLEGTALVDLKTTKDINPRGFLKAIENNRYYVQASTYLKVYNLVAEQNGLPIKDQWVYVAVQKEAPYLVMVYRQAPLDLELGHQMMMKACRRIKFCQDSPFAWKLAYPGDRKNSIKTLALSKYVYENADLAPDPWMSPEWRHD